MSGSFGPFGKIGKFPAVDKPTEPAKPPSTNGSTGKPSSTNSSNGKSSSTNNGKPPTNPVKISSTDLSNYNPKIIQEIVQMGIGIQTWWEIDAWIELSRQKLNYTLTDSENNLKWVFNLKEKVDEYQPGHNGFFQLNDNDVYESGQGGASGTVGSTKLTGGCDCLILSFLSCVSPTLRRLKSEAHRDVFASIFRRIILPEWFSEGTQSDTIQKLKSNICIYLEEGTAEDIGNRLKINILFVQVLPNYGPKASFSEAEAIEGLAASFPTISIHGTSDHFRPVEFNFGGGVKTFVAAPNQFNGNDFIMKLTPTVSNITRGKFSVGDSVRYVGPDKALKGKLFWIIDPRYDTTLNVFGSLNVIGYYIFEKRGDWANNFPNVGQTATKGNKTNVIRRINGSLTRFFTGIKNEKSNIYNKKNGLVQPILVKPNDIVLSSEKKELVRAIKLSMKRSIKNNLHDEEERKIDETYNNTELNLRIREATEAAANIPLDNRAAGASVPGTSVAGTSAAGTRAAASMTSTSAALAAQASILGNLHKQRIARNQAQQSKPPGTRRRRRRNTKRRSTRRRY